MSLMPRFLAIGNMIGAISTMAGSPSSTQPSTMKTTIVTSHVGDPAAGQVGMKRGELLGEAGLRQRPGHGRAPCRG